jgi:hypothetical protein
MKMSLPGSTLSHFKTFPLSLAQLDKMRFSSTTIFIIAPLLVSANPTTEKPRITIPLNKGTNFYHSDGSVDIEVLKRQAAYSTVYAVFPFNRL